MDRIPDLSQRIAYEYQTKIYTESHFPGDHRRDQPGNDYHVVTGRITERIIFAGSADRDGHFQRFPMSGIKCKLPFVSKC
jgi:hypothetical protein